ncbi:MAG: PIG-L deacetylase family protein [Acidimicrobiales bacterium]
MTGDVLPAIRNALAVVAHPDDESFGLGSLLAAIVEGGGTVDVVCFTAGEVSTLGPPAQLAQRRARELRDAAEVLGVRHVHLAGFPDGELGSVPVTALTDLLRRQARRPDVVVVFEPSGVTGHPDHQAATAAGERFAAERGAAVLQWGVSPAVASGLNDEFGTSFTGLAGADVLEVRVDRAAQTRAVACHASQVEGNAVLPRRLALSGGTEVVRFVPAPAMASNVSQGGAS